MGTPLAACFSLGHGAVGDLDKPMFDVSVRFRDDGSPWPSGEESFLLSRSDLSFRRSLESSLFVASGSRLEFLLSEAEGPG